MLHHHRAWIAAITTPATPLSTPLRSAAKPSSATIVTLLAVALIAFYAWGLSALYGREIGFLIDQSGLPRTNEYAGVRAAGELALSGRPADAYDWVRHEAQMAILTGRPVKYYFQYPYPPSYFLVAAPLALLPYLASALLWIGLTAALFVWGVGRIVGLRLAGLWALASPATAFNAFVAHTGFWTAGVSGLAIEALQKRPILAGALFGLLSFKPQLAILVPVALIAGGYWRSLISAGVTALLLALFSLLIFGVEPWLEFPGQMTRIGDAIRFGKSRTGEVNFNLLVTAYGFLRAVGVADGPALAGQALMGLAVAAGTALLWRSTVPFALKAAGLASASLLVTPYLFIYDLTHLGVAAAFLLRHTGLGGLTRTEIAVFGTAMALILFNAFLPLPLGFLANLMVGLVVAARIISELAPPPLERTGTGSQLPA